MGDVRNRITSGIQVSLCEDSSPLLDSSSSPPARCGLMRYVVVGLLAGGFFFDYLLRVNISFALDGGMSKHNISDVHDTGKYAWSQQMQGNYIYFKTIVIITKTSQMLSFVHDHHSITSFVFKCFEQ